MSLTQQVIAKLRPEEKPFEVRDERIKGFLLRVQPSGRKSFVVEYARGKRITLGCADVLTLTQARQMAQDILGQYAQGKDPMAERRAARAGTLGEFLDKHYAPWAESHQRASTDTVTRVRKCFPDLLQKQLAEITPWLIEKYRFTRQRQGIAASTLNRDVAALKGVLGKAEAWGTVAESPLKGLSMAKVDQPGVARFLSSDEERRLLAALPQAPAYLRAMVAVSLHTGLRRGELFALEWRDIELERRSLAVRGETSKSRRTRHVPLNEVAYKTLTEWKGRDSPEGLVFPGRHGERLDNTRKSFASLLKAADIQAFRWHDMRHHFASKLVMAGVDLTTVQELLGHQDPKVTLIYAHLSPEHKAAAVARLAG
jgi:integrase